MLGYAIRRLLWAIPTLFGISLIAFFLTTLIPDPYATKSGLGTSVLGAQLAVDETIHEERRSRFLDLPRFFNSNPEDVRSRAAESVEHILKDDALRSAASHELVILGGAALPYILPQLEAYAPEDRARLALALAPIALRMGAAEEDALGSAERAVLFWSRFWDDRSLDFSEPAAKRTVRRFLDYGEEHREKDVLLLDTFALSALFTELRHESDPARIKRITEILARITGRYPSQEMAASEAVKVAWLEWWYIHQSDYVALSGIERIAATLSETRYGKWTLRVGTGQLGVSVRDGLPVIAKLRSHAPLTILLALLALFASYAFAVPIGIVAAYLRGRAFDGAVAGALFILYSIPTFCLAELLRRALSPSGAAGPLALATLALTATSLATLSRYQRTALLDVLGQDYIRTARAKGVSGIRLLFVHALRNALLPTVTLAGLQWPALLGGVLVVEEVFSLPGLGYETVRAVEAHDVPWLMAIIVGSALLTTFGLLGSDIAYATLDPRVRETLLRPRRGVG